MRLRQTGSSWNPSLSALAGAGRPSRRQSTSGVTGVTWRHPAETAARPAALIFLYLFRILCLECGHIEIVQDIDGAEQNLDRLPDWEVQVATFDHNIVLPMRIVGIQAQRGVGTDVAGIGRAHPAILPREAEAPAPLLAHDLDLGSVRRNRDELVPDNQAGCQHGSDADSSPYGEPPFDLFVSGLVGCPPSLLVMKAEDAIGHERDDREENRPGDPERDGDRVVDVAPVCGDRRPPPRAEKGKTHRP